MKIVLREQNVDVYSENIPFYRHKRFFYAFFYEKQMNDFMMFTALEYATKNSKWNAHIQFFSFQFVD